MGGGIQDTYDGFFESSQDDAAQRRKADFLKELDMIDIPENSDDDEYFF